MVIPCPKCAEERSPMSLNSGDPGMPVPELEPVEGRKGIVECIYGHRFRIKLEKVGRFGF